MNEETIRNQWGSVWVSNHKQKQHLNPNCEYVNDDAVQKDMAVYPANHLDICERCVEHFKNWIENNEKQPKSERCERCGAECESEYCDDCEQTIRLRQLQR